MSFSARISLAKRKWRPSEDHEERSSNPSTAASPTRSRPAPVIYPDEITALYSYTIDWRKKMCGEESDRPLGAWGRWRWQAKKRKTEQKRKERPVIGIGAVEKPWKINYRRAKEWKIISIGVVCPHEGDWYPPLLSFKSAKRCYR